MEPLKVAGDRAVIGAISQMVSGYIHEVNNKLGPILLNAEILASSPHSEVSAAAADISGNAHELMEMARALEAALPREAASSVQVDAMLKLSRRLVRGALRRRRLHLELPEIGQGLLLGSNPFASLVVMILIPFAFKGPDAGEQGIVRLLLEDDGEAFRTWRVLADPPAEFDGKFLEPLERLCACLGWKLQRGDGWISIVVRKEA
jgi:signal transduction histidine kinase